MPKLPNVFISWSGPRSRYIAAFLREWLPLIIQAVVPWMSETDIEKGSRGLEEISRNLSTAKIGISCLTPENLNSSWILYEAGALSKTIDDQTRLCTYLLCGLGPRDVPLPLGLFQHTIAEKEDTRKLLHAVNKAIRRRDPLPGSTLDKLFEKFWPELEQALMNMRKVRKGANVKRSIAALRRRKLAVVKAIKKVGVLAKTATRTSGVTRSRTPRPGPWKPNSVSGKRR